MSEGQIDLSPVKNNSKIVNMTVATGISADAKKKGLKVVLAHGVFDLVHLGHVRHLEAAKREGDVLMVSVTDDHHVNKGPGRPVFPAPMRAEMLASLHMVDWVVINDAATAVSVLKVLNPSIYIKGSEYAKAEEDITGKIADEQAAVEAGGGRIVFTDDIVFSSSSLINQFMDVYHPELRDYLENVREKSSLDEITGWLEKVADFKVLLVGDAIIDEYQYVSPMGKSPKENMIATQFLNREIFAGGVFAAANHVANFCSEVEVITCLGREESYEDLIRSHLKPNVKLNAIYREGKPTTRKCRFVDWHYLRKMFEVYFFEDAPLPGEYQQELDALILQRAGQFDLVIVTDFGHGLIGPSSVRALEENARFLAVNAQSNSANHGYNLITKYPKASYICIDAPEARLAVSDKFSDIESVIREKLAPRTQCERIIVTHGDQGCITYDVKEGIHRVPAFTNTIVDTVGAGDAFLSVTSPFVASGAPLNLVGFIGNAAGAMKVGIVGHRRSIEKVPLIKYITRLLK